jgi:hypothetical protein
MDDLVPGARDTPEYRAECILSNAVDAADDAQAVEAVRQLGLDPATIPHQPPRTRRHDHGSLRHQLLYLDAGAGRGAAGQGLVLA